MNWVSRLFGKRKREEELDEEVRSHLEMAARERVERGVDDDEAVRAARREFGNVELVREVTRDAWGWGFLDRWMQDLRFGVRMIAKSPVFAAVAILTLALGIGANTALFSVVNGVLLNPLPYPQPEQLVAVRQSKANFEWGTIPYPNFRDWQKDNRTFSSMAVWRNYAFSLTGTGEAEQVNGQFVSSDFLQILGVKPLLGRPFAPGEDEIGAAPIAVISEGLWRRKFNSATDVLGKGLTLDGKSYTIVGVIPASLHFPMGSASARREVFVPIGQWKNNLLTSRGAGLGINGIGRLKPGVTIEQARADMATVTNNLAMAFPDVDKGKSAK